MADEDLGRIWSDENARDDREDRQINPLEIPGRKPGGDISKRRELTGAPVAPGVPEEHVETDEERSARERIEFIAAADDTEIVEEGRSTTAYRRAVSVFDPSDDNLQLAEFYHVRSESIDRYGRF